MNDKNYIETILDSITEGVFTVDPSFRITSFNRAAELMTGVPREEALGRHCWEVLRASICEGQCALRQTLETGRPVVNKAIYLVNNKGERVPVSISTAVLRDKQGKVLGGVETLRDLSLVEELRKELAGRYTFADMVSKSPRMQEIFAILPEVAASDSTVLIQGESGTGKELLARAIHSLSPRREKPFVAINCGALPDTLLESELFGYKAGAFTGAVKDKPGRFARAEGGTVFLDEIGDVSPALQIRLLRFLQEKTYEPLGGDSPVRADVRILAATNKRLEELVQKGVFREDLYYRVNVVKLVLPPLRERKEDIPLLLEHFIARQRRLTGKEITGITPRALAVLMAHDYPGNVRELENIVEHAFVLCPGGEIDLEHLPEGLRCGVIQEPSESGRKGMLRELERRAIEEALRQTGGNKKAAAELLGIHKSTLFRKLKRLKLAAR